jgi:hypothetical protein
VESVPGADAWLNAYKLTHQAIMSDPERRQKEVVIFEAHYNGFGDRFISAVSTFAFAVLSNRAFQVRGTVDWKAFSSRAQMTFSNKNNLPHKSVLEVMQPNNIDWAWSATACMAKGNTPITQHMRRYGSNKDAIPTSTMDRKDFGSGFQSDVDIGAAE